MPDPHQAVIGGIDCHTDSRVAVALDPLGRVVGTESFPATAAGYRSTLCQLGDLLVTAPAALREQLDGRRTLEAEAAVCARLRPDADRLADPAQAAEAALRSLGGRIARLGSEASFAHLCATAPVPASSGRTSRHRLNFAGNRAANRALHMIVIVRLRYCELTRSYMDRRLAEGKTEKEVIRCLKRFVARELYRTLRADLATLTTRT